MVQKALKMVVRDALRAVAANGLPGSHHFYVTFRTDHPQAVVPTYLAERHPEEITIVLQYQFWDLDITDHSFEVTLSFNDIHERLVVPFNAITSFVDPSVKFGLQFAPIMELSQDMMDFLPQQESPVRPEETQSGSSNVIVLDAFRKK
ncbi:MAG: hypothetical protein J0G29_02295 [Alphaproteobacteria bacterium]|nr:hypothetical protein [Alphaproteobacteria bacterium]OJV45698.1 MAG: hypothetical protein BGO28_02380 [Alphaproteobacteria bacterium 43-37]